MISLSLRHWFENRLPRDDRWALGQRNLYILPTAAGWSFGLTLALMLLASINYQLNLGYGLCFLLLGAALVSMHQTHANLRGLVLHLKPPLPVFATQAVAIDIVLDNPGSARHAIGLTLHGAQRQGLTVCDLPAQGSASARLLYTAAARGRQQMPTLRAESRFPLGLFRAWTLWRPAAQLLVYPRPEPAAPALPMPACGDRGEQPARNGAGGEFEGVRAYRRGDPMRQLAWKKIARSGDLVSRDTRASVAQALRLDAAMASAMPIEARLSRLTAWVLAADKQGLAYSLRLPGLALAPASGPAQCRAALQALALWQPGIRAEE
ncbi:MAG: DUF58 domain-containing protein [Betaproteobacteria bacterium]|nr:DUF58 domain-containing protein [Betaproteobacteria bacterium]